MTATQCTDMYVCPTSRTAVIDPVELENSASDWTAGTDARHKIEEQEALPVKTATERAIPTSVHRIGYAKPQIRVATRR